MQKIRPTVILSFLAILLASCAKEGPNGPTGPAGPVYYGNISGFVSLYDKYGSKILTGQNSAYLYLSNTVIAINPTASTGYYVFENEPTDAYSITATDSAFAATVVYFNFVSGDLNKNIGLSVVPDSFITNFSVTHTTTTDTLAAADSLYISATPDTRLRNCIVFVNTTAASNISYLLSYIIPIPGNTTTVSFAAPRQDLVNAGLTSGTLVYYAAYSYVVNDASVYQNTSSGAYVYNAVYPNPIAGVDTTRVP